MKTLRRLLPVMLAIGLVPAFGWADTPATPAAPAAPSGPPTPTPENFVQYRQKVMTAIFANCSAIGDILKTGLPYQKEIPVHAKLLKGNLGMIEVAFKQKVAEGKTDAKAAVWDEWAKFEGKVKALDAEVTKLEAVAAKGNAGEIGAQMGKVGGACKSCHDDFRKPKEESYKNAK